MKGSGKGGVKREPKDYTFLCGACNLYEQDITEEELLSLSALHFGGQHIDKHELRRRAAAERTKMKPKKPKKEKRRVLRVEDKTYDRIVDAVYGKDEVYR